MSTVLMCIRGALMLEVLRAACLDFCVQFWFTVKHSESGSRKG